MNAGQLLLVVFGLVLIAVPAAVVAGATGGLLHRMARWLKQRRSP